MNEDLTIHIEDVSRWHPPHGQLGQGILLHTTRGDVHTIAHSGGGGRTRKGIVFVWGARGGFDGPAEGIYGRLGEDLKDDVTSLRVDYRMPNDLTECVLDTLAGVSFLSATGHTEVALVGHSFGGAVVIAAAPFSPVVKAVAALSPQTFGATGAGDVSPRPLLLLHGGADSRLPPRCSELIYEWAREPKRIIIYPGAEHGLAECKDELRETLKGWLADRLAEAADAAETAESGDSDVRGDNDGNGGPGGEPAG